MKESKEEAKTVVMNETEAPVKELTKQEELIEEVKKIDVEIEETKAKLYQLIGVKTGIIKAFETLKENK